MPTISRPERTSIDLDQSNPGMVWVSAPQYFQNAPRLSCRLSKDSPGDQTIFIPVRPWEHKLEDSLQDPRRGFGHIPITDLLTLEQISVKRSWEDLQREMLANASQIGEHTMTTDADWSISNEIFQYQIDVDAGSFIESSEGKFAVPDTSITFTAHKVSETDTVLVPRVEDENDASNHVTRDHCRVILGRTAIEALNSISSRLSGSGDWELLQVLQRSQSSQGSADSLLTGTFKCFVLEA